MYSRYRRGAPGVAHESFELAEIPAVGPRADENVARFSCAKARQMRPAFLAGFLQSSRPNSTGGGKRMNERRKVTVDGNEAVASVAHRIERGHRDLPHHALISPWASSRTSGRPRGAATSGDRARDPGDAVGRRGGRGRPRSAPGRGPDDDVHRVPGAPPHDPQHVQDRRRADALLHARGRPHRWPPTRSRSSATTPT